MGPRSHGRDDATGANGDDAPEHQVDPPGIDVRRAYIYKADILEAGYSENCPGCRAMMQGKAQQAHSEACMKKVEAHLATTEVGRTRLARAANRITSAHERADERASRAGNMGQTWQVLGQGEEENAQRRLAPDTAAS